MTIGPAVVVVEVVEDKVVVLLEDDEVIDGPSAEQSMSEKLPTSFG